MDLMFQKELYIVRPSLMAVNMENCQTLFLSLLTGASLINLQFNTGK